MSQIVRIRKGEIISIVPMGAYETVYKPKGWSIVENDIENTINSELKGKGLIDEKRQNEYIKSKIETHHRVFSDGLFKGDD